MRITLDYHLQLFRFPSEYVERECQFKKKQNETKFWTTKSKVAEKKKLL